jgi:hypothetical protein
MFSWISSAISVIRAIFDLIKMIKDWQESEREKEALNRQLARDQAIENLKNAKTEEEIWDAQERIANSKL